jgi:hypothetical protein
LAHTAGPTALARDESATEIPFSVPSTRSDGEELVSNITLQGNAGVEEMLLRANKRNTTGSCLSKGRRRVKGTIRYMIGAMALTARKMRRRPNLFATGGNINNCRSL